MTRLAALAFATSLLAGGAFGQPASIGLQVPNQSQAVDVGTPLAVPTTEAPAQISNGGDSTTSETQLTSARASHQQPTQLSTGPRDTQASAPLSRVAEGRTAAVERVEGTDRCDPAVPKDKQSEECKKVIETRADDYARPPATELSPEQRLLLDQQLEGAGEPLADAAHRLATSGESDNSTESMGIAAIVLQQSQQKQEPEKQDDPTSDAAVQAIIQLMNQTPQN